jgi:hypothetical protein
MDKPKPCNVCGSDEKVTVKGGIALCRRCLRVIYDVLQPKNRQNDQECSKKPKPR